MSQESKLITKIKVGLDTLIEFYPRKLKIFRNNEVILKKDLPEFPNGVLRDATSLTHMDETVSFVVSLYDHIKLNPPGANLKKESSILQVVSKNYPSKYSNSNDILFDIDFFEDGPRCVVAGRGDEILLGFGSHYSYPPRNSWLMTHIELAELKAKQDSGVERHSIRILEAGDIMQEGFRCLPELSPLFNELIITRKNIVRHLHRYCILSTFTYMPKNRTDNQYTRGFRAPNKVNVLIGIADQTVDYMIIPINPAGEKDTPNGQEIVGTTKWLLLITRFSLAGKNILADPNLESFFFSVHKVLRKRLVVVFGLSECVKRYGGIRWLNHDFTIVRGAQADGLLIVRSSKYFHSRSTDIIEKLQFD